MRFVGSSLICSPVVKAEAYCVDLPESLSVPPPEQLRSPRGGPYWETPAGGRAKTYLRSTRHAQAKAALDRLKRLSKAAP